MAKIIHILLLLFGVTFGIFHGYRDAPEGNITCHKYDCDTETYVTDSLFDTCIRSDRQNTFYIKQCDHENRWRNWCPPMEHVHDYFSNCTVPITTVYPSGAGMPCNYTDTTFLDLPCVSSTCTCVDTGVCNTAKCKGSAANAFCTTSDKCNAGLYCDGTQCKS